MEYIPTQVLEPLRQQLIDYCYPYISCMIAVHKDLGRGMPEYLYQEALKICFEEQGYKTHREYQHHPIFHGRTMTSYLKMDLMVETDRGNIVVECKAIKNITDVEQYQLFGYLRGTGFPVGILVNFGTWPKAQIQRYYYNKDTGEIRPF